jgi:hypothetical protein
MVPSGRLGQTNPLYFLSDYLGLLVDPLNTGFALAHTFFRYLAFCAAALTLWRWRRERDARWFVGALSLGWLLALTYLAALLPGLREMEPYRFVAPSMFLAAVLAGPWLARVLAPSALRALSPAARALLLVAALLALPRGLREIFYYYPELWPAGLLGRPLTPEAAMPVRRRGPPQILRLRLTPVPPDYQEVRRRLLRHCRQQGRVLVQRWPLAEYLRWSTDRPIIGGFPDRRTIHEDANLFRYPDDPRREGQALSSYLVQYNVRYLLMSGHYVPRLESRKDLLDPPMIIGQHRIYHVRHRGTYFASGAGQLRAGLNRIVVSGARPAAGTQQLVLRFHHLGTLRCRPGCAVVRHPVPGNRAGFIRIEGRPTLPSQFVVENLY